MRCVECGAVLSTSREAPRIRLFCSACRPDTSTAPDELTATPARLLSRRWPARRVLRLLLVALALCIFLIRLLGR